MLEPRGVGASKGGRRRAPSGPRPCGTTPPHQRNVEAVTCQRLRCALAVGGQPPQRLGGRARNAGDGVLGQQPQVGDGAPRQQRIHGVGLPAQVAHSAGKGCALALPAVQRSRNGPRHFRRACAASGAARKANLSQAHPVVWQRGLVNSQGTCECEGEAGACVYDPAVKQSGRLLLAGRRAARNSRRAQMLRLPSCPSVAMGWPGHSTDRKCIRSSQALAGTCWQHRLVACTAPSPAVRCVARSCSEPDRLGRVPAIRPPVPPPPGLGP